MFTIKSRHQLAAAILLMCVLLVLGGSPAAAQGSGSLRATLVQTTDTSQWSPPSPDPSGITYWSDHDTLLVVDGEVDEMPQVFCRGQRLRGDNWGHVGRHL